MKPILFRALLSLACLSAVPHVHAQADTTFTVESPAFADNGGKLLIWYGKLLRL